MDRDTVIALAREAGALVSADGSWHKFESQKSFERFAALVAAHEREKVAAWMIARGYATGHGDTIEDLLAELEWQIRESEREACAKVCEETTASWTQHLYNQGCIDCAKAIRGRT